MATRKIEVAITGDSRSLERAFRRSANASETFGRRVTKGAGQGLLLLGKGGAVAAVAGLAAVGVGLVKSAKAAAEAEASNARLRAQLKAMGKDNVRVRANIEQTVQSLSKLGAFDDEDLQDAFTTLVRSSGSVAKSQKDLALVADIARGAQIDLATAAKLVNRVNAGNVGSLKRYGIALEDGATKEQALAALRQKFAGQAGAYANTAAGAQEALNVALENTFEQIGVALTPVIIEFSKFAQDVLPKVAAAVSTYLGQAIAWIKANWPQIRAVLVAVWEGVKWAVENVLAPAMKGAIAGIGLLVGYVRQNMPQIRAAAQAAFGWIQDNIVPTVRTVAHAVSVAVSAMATVWREHGDTIKQILTPVYNTMKQIIVTALTIIRESIEFWLALIRGDWGKAFDSLKTIARTALDGVIAVLTMYPKIALEAAKTIGVRIVDGIISGLGGLYGRVKAKLESDLRSVVDKLNPFSPVQHGGEIIANRLADGMIVGLSKRRASIAKGLSEAVRGAVESARGNLASLTSGLAGMLGTLFGSNSAEAKRLRQIRAQQAKQNDIRRRAELQAAIDSAETDEDRAKAKQDLDDYLLDYEADQLQQLIDDKQDAYFKDIANLTESFNNGLISADKFKEALGQIIGGQTGAELGAAFAGEFGRQLEAITKQIAALAGAPSGVGGPSVENPADVAKQELADWKQKRAARLKELQDAARGERTPGGKKITDAEQDRIDKLMTTWDKNHPKPKQLAMGGVLRRAVIAGEAGPEAVLPLTSGRAQGMLADALQAADRINGGRGGTTVINVTVSGNEFSARDFAKKLQPELNRLVGFGQV